jgi:hypothetical protein
MQPFKIGPVWRRNGVNVADRTALSAQVQARATH